MAPPNIVWKMFPVGESSSTLLTLLRAGGTSSSPPSPWSGISAAISAGASALSVSESIDPSTISAGGSGRARGDHPPRGPQTSAPASAPADIGPSSISCEAMPARAPPAGSQEWRCVTAVAYFDIALLNLGRGDTARVLLAVGQKVGPRGRREAPAWPRRHAGSSRGFEGSSAVWIRVQGTTLVPGSSGTLTSSAGGFNPEPEL